MVKTTPAFKVGHLKFGLVHTSTHLLNRPIVLNSQLRRIDLFCKLGGPLAISLIDGFSTVVALYMVLGTNILSVFIEYYAIRRVSTFVLCATYGMPYNEWVRCIS